MTELPSDRVAAARQRAEADAGSVLDLARQLIRIPSRAGEDPYHPVVTLLEKWFAERSLPVRQLTTRTGVGLACQVTGDRPGPH
jgi:succinyl-diaminopimelate desuccinylase